MPDLFEGEDEVREAVCDWSRHDWEQSTMFGDVEVCTACGAMQTAQQGQKGKAER